MTIKGDIELIEHLSFFLIVVSVVVVLVPAVVRALKPRRAPGE